jgi:soluble lytic murein transglycosylase
MLSRPLPLLAASFGFAILACSAPLTGLVEPTPTATSTPEPTATPTSIPTPTPAPEQQLDRAEWALFIGDWGEAIDQYRLVLQMPTEDALAGSAQLGLASTYLRSGRNQDALTALSDYLENYSEHEHHSLGYFLRAVAYEQEGDLPRALSDYQAFLEEDPRNIEAYVLERLGDILRELDRPLEAADRYREALSHQSLDGEVTLEVKIGIAYFEADDYGTALSQFQKVYEIAGDGPTKATANLLQGRVYELLGESEAAQERYLDSFANFPTAYDTYLGLIELVEAGVPVDDFRRGLVDYHAGAYDPALRALGQAAEKAPTASVYFYRGLTLRELGDPSGARQDFLYLINTYPDSPEWTEAWFELAITEWLYLDLAEPAVQTYLSFVATNPSNPRAPEALDRAASLLERLGMLDEAAETWLRLVSDYPDSARGHGGGMLAGVIRYRQLRLEEAEEAFTQAESAALDAEARSAALFWIGKARHAKGEEATATEAWTRSAAADPTGYYSERSADYLANRPTFESTGVLQFPADLEAERSEAEAWLEMTFGYAGSQPIGDMDPSLREDPRLLRGRTFLELGMYGRAKQEFEALRAELANDAIATYRFMEFLMDLDLYQPAIFAARTILDLAGMDDAGTLSAPIYFNRIRFGLYYGDLILPAAQEHGIDPLLLFSVVRQESLFEGFATSYAAARGLMQVIPPTGADIAAQLGWPPGYDEDDLYRPLVSVRFGSYYLAQQRDLFEGNMVVALSAYNAGPGNALTWNSLAPTDSDLYLEVIRLDQPQEYIRSIYEIYRIYQGIYTES